MKTSEVRDEMAVTTRDGLMIKIFRWGCGASPVSVLIHGLGEGAFVWDLFISNLPDGRGVVAIDLRGHGDSSWDTTGLYDLDTYVDDVRQVLSTLELNEYFLVGHSLGGDIAIKIAAEKPLGLAGIVLVDAGPSEEGASANSEIQARILDLYRCYSTIDEYVELVREARPLASSEVIRALAHKSLRCRGGMYQAKFDEKVVDILSGEADEFWWWAALGQTLCPILIVRGEASAALTASVCQKMISKARNAYLITIKQAGHAVMTDNPKAFLEAVRKFIRWDG